MTLNARSVPVRTLYLCKTDKKIKHLKGAISIPPIKGHKQCCGSAGDFLISESGSRIRNKSTSGSVGQRYGSKDPDPHPDPYQNVTSLQHCLLRAPYILIKASFIATDPQAWNKEQRRSKEKNGMKMGGWAGGGGTYLVPVSRLYAAPPGGLRGSANSLIRRLQLPPPGDTPRLLYRIH
jgi:hypothetical protein